METPPQAMTRLVGRHLNRQTVNSEMEMEDQPSEIIFQQRMSTGWATWPDNTADATQNDFEARAWSRTEIRFVVGANFIRDWPKIIKTALCVVNEKCPRLNQSFAKDYKRSGG